MGVTLKKPQSISALLVEDSPSDARLVRELLKDGSSDDLRLCHVESLADARQRLTESAFDCMLLDLGLPDAERLEALSEVQALAPGTPIVILSGLDDERLAVKAVQEGAQDYLVKGHFDGIGLDRAIHYAIERQRADVERAQLAAIVDSSDDAIISESLAGVIRSWNHGAEQIYGYSSEEAVGEPISLLVPPGPADEIPALLKRISRGELIDHYETKRVRKDGTQVDVSLTISPTRDANGVISGASAISRDISERIRAEARFKGLLESAPDAMVILDNAGEIVLANTQTEKLFGYTREELVGQPVEILTPEHSHAKYPEYRSESSSDPLGHPMGAGPDLWGIRKDGTEFPVEISLSPLETEDGMLATAAIRDVTERREVEAELARTAAALEENRAELQRSNEDLEQFASVAAHDLSEPLRAIAGMVQLLAKRYEGRLGEDADEYISGTVEGTRRLQTLIDDLLAYARIGHVDLSNELIDCSALVGQIFEGLNEEIEGSQAAASVDPLPNVYGDATQLRQVFQNLIANALKYKSSTDPRIAISAEREPGGWRFAVTDNGIGIEPRHSKRIFEVFKRLHGRAAYPGTGIGLSICKRIVERHGGRIWVEPASGGGSHFYFTIPDRGQAST